MAKSCNDLNLESVELVSASESDLTIFVAEGMALANYQFLKYKKEKNKETHSLKSVSIVSLSESVDGVESVWL